MDNKIIKPPPTISKLGYAYLAMSIACLLFFIILTVEFIPFTVTKILFYVLPPIILTANLVLFVIACKLYRKNILVASIPMMIFCKLISAVTIISLLIVGIFVIFGTLWLMSWVLPFFAIELEYNRSYDGENISFFSEIMKEGTAAAFLLGPSLIIIALILVFAFSFPIMLNLNTLRKYKKISLTAQLLYTLLLFVPVLDFLVCIILIFTVRKCTQGVLPLRKSPRT